MSDISEKRQRRWLLFLTVKNFRANSDWNIEEQKPKAWVENNSYATILPSLPWTPNSRSETNIKLKFLLLEIDCYNYYFKRLAYLG